VQEHLARRGSLLPWLRLVRVGTLFSPAADVVAGLCLADHGWSVEAVRAVAASVLLYAAGMVLNDCADRAEDARLRPERPLPSGQIRPGAALALGAALCGASLLVAPWRLWYAAMAALVVLYDFLLKRHPLGAVVAMGTLRALNLLAGAVVTTRAAPEQGHVLGAALAYGVYVAAVTVLGMFEDARRIAPRAALAVQTVPPLCAVGALGFLPERWPALGIGLALAVAFSVRLRRQGDRWDRTAIRASMTWLLLGTMLFTSLCCLGAGRPVESAAVAAAVLPARWIARRIAPLT
jgi:4-hydroxybenzoate polyprenyltransferase